MSTPVLPARPRVAVPCACLLGEGPVWDGRSGTLFFVDIKGQAVWRWRPGSGEEASTIGLDEPVSFVRSTPDPDVAVVGLASGVARLHLPTGRTALLLRPEPDEAENRLNDADVGPDGALWFGSMHGGETRPSGGFHRWSQAGHHRFGEPAVVTNGPAVDAARGLVYTADTQAGRIHRHAIESHGGPGDRSDFIVFGEGDGHPDGLTIDAEGCLWVCHWGGARVTRFSVDGEPILVVPMPTAQVTKAAFGGPDLSTLYITTAAIGRDRETDLLAGHLFEIEPGVRGVPAELCRVEDWAARP